MTPAAKPRVSEALLTAALDIAKGAGDALKRDLALDLRDSRAESARWREVATALAGELRLWGRSAEWDQCRECECDWDNVMASPKHSIGCTIGDALARFETMRLSVDAMKKEADDVVR